MSDNYALDLLGTLDQSKSKKQINSDIKQLEKAIKALRLTATFAKADTKKELNAYITQLSNQLSTIKLKVKIDNKALKNEINKALNNVSFKDIDTLNIDENKTKLKVQKVIADTKSYVENNPIVVGINISSKKNKLDNDLTTYLNKNTKINESSVLLEEANKVRDLIDAITDKKSLTEATDAFRLFKSEVSATGYTSKSTADKVKSMLSHLTKIGSAFGVASMLINNFTKSLKTLRENDTILTEISKTSEMTKNQLKELGDEAFKIASKYGQLSSNFLLATQEMARAGYDDNVKGMAELSTKAQGAGDMTAELSNQYIIATDKAFKMNGSIETLTATLDGANNITNNNALAMADLAEAMSIVGSQAASSGMEVDETTAAVATMIAVTQRSGSEAANAFKGILMNLRQVSGDVGDGEDIIDADSLTKYEKACAELGVSLSTVKDGVVSLKEPMQIIKELAEAYTQLDEADAKRANLLSAVGGKYRANALNAILENYDMYEKMLKEYADGLGSMDAEAEKTAKSWEGRLNSLQNSWDSFINTLTNKEAIMGGISFLDRLIQGAEILTDIIGEIPVVLSTLNTAMTAMNKDYGITHLVNRDSGKFDIQGNIFGIDFTAIKNQKKHFEEAEGAINLWNDAMLNGENSLDSFSGCLVKNNAQFKAYLQTTSKDAPASLSGYKAYLNAAGISTDALRIKTILLNSAISFGIGAAIQLAVKGITYLIQREENLRQATEEAANTYKESASSVEDYTSRYQELHKALLEAKGDEEETYNIKKQLLDLQTELNNKYGDEYGAINLLSDAYRDQTEVIKALNKETAQTFLNENKEGIDKAKKEMSKDRHYNLSYTGISSYTDDGAALKEIAEKYKDKGIWVNEDISTGTYNLILNADAQSAYDTINEFENEIREKAKELGDEHIFDDVLEISSSELNRAKETIEKYGDTYKQALTAEIVSDDDKSKIYGEALKAVEAYNEAVLNSENPYDDQNVIQAKENLDTIRDSIQGNEEELGKYSILFSDVFDQADTRLIDFNEAIKSDSGLQELAKDLEGLSDLDLQALNENVGENESFDKLKEAAGKYKLNVEELINTLIRLGYVQGEIQNTVPDTAEQSIAPTISSSVEQIARQLEPQFAKLGEAYKEIFTDDGFTLNSVDNSMLESLRKSFAEIEEEVGVVFDSTKLEPFFDTLINGNSTAEQVQQVFNDLATAYFYSTDTLKQLNEETAESIVKQLEEMGVVNAQEVVYDELNAKTEAMVLQKKILAETGIDVMNASNDVIYGLLNEAGASETARLYLFNLAAQEQIFNDNTLDTSGKVEKLQELATAYGQTAVAARIAAMQEMYADNHMPVDYANILAAAQAEISNAISSVQIDFKGAGSVNKSGSTSASPKTEKDTTKEYDWIEQAIENVEKEIKELDEVADSSYSTFSQKNEALTKEIGKVTEEIELQQKAYEEYMRKADSIGLPDSYKELVQNGALNIEDIKDEKLQEQIDGYQKWYEKAQKASDAINDLKTDLKDLHVESYKLQTDDLKSRLDSDSITEKQYLAGLKSAYEKYYANLSDYAQQYHEAVLEYLEEEKKYLNSVASAAASLVDTEIKRIQDITEEQEEQIKSQIELLEDRKKPLQDELDALDEKVRKEELALNLQKAQYDLARAENQRTKLIYTADKGMIYTSDPEAIRDAKKDVDDAKLEIQKQSIQDQIVVLDDEIDRYNDLIDQINKAADVQVKALEKIKNKWQEVIDQQEYAKNVTLLTGEFGADAVIKILTGNDDDLLAQWKNSYINTLKSIDSESQGYIGDMTRQIESLYRDSANAISTAAEKAIDAVTTKAVQNVSGKATTLPDGTIITPDGDVLIPVSQEEYIQSLRERSLIQNNRISADEIPPEMPMWERMEKCAAVLGRSVEDLLNPLNLIALDLRKETGVGRLLESINNVNNVTNNNRNIQQPVTVQIGDIHLTGVQDVNGLAQAIKTRLPGQMMQEYFKN